jgi:hypothetical protein
MRMTRMIWCWIDDQDDDDVSDDNMMIWYDTNANGGNNNDDNDGGEMIWRYDGDDYSINDATQNDNKSTKQQSRETR